MGGWYLGDLNLCDEIIDFHKNSKDVKRGEIFKMNDGGKSSLDLTIKDSFDLSLLISPELTKKYVDELQQIINLYIEKYTYCNMQAPFGLSEKIVIQHYLPKGGYFDWHCERGSKEPVISARHLVFITYLNDVEDDGETEFFYQNLKIKPKKGLTVIFPADWTFTHRGIPSKSQEKYIVTGWLNYL